MNEESHVVPSLPTTYGNGLSYYEEMKTVCEKVNEVVENVNDHEHRIEELENGGGSNVTMEDNPNGGVDLTVDDLTRTLAKESELSNYTPGLIFQTWQNTVNTRFESDENNILLNGGKINELESNVNNKLNKTNMDGEMLQFVDTNNNRNSLFNSYNAMYTESDDENIFMSSVNGNEISVVTAKIETGNEQHIEIKSDKITVSDFDDLSDTNISISDLKNIKDIAEIKNELVGVSDILGSGVFE